VPVTLVSVLVAGLIVLLVPGAGDYGWFAYAPLPQQAAAPDGVIFLGFRARIGIALICMALLGMAFWAGFRTGLRRIPAD
jgi:heme/copper-type cytochrome/quinol oxidase subunit 1